MLLLNRGVLNGSTIMFESGGVPEDQFPLGRGGAAADEAVRGRRGGGAGRRGSGAGW
jgi:hypothetical protein